MVEKEQWYVYFLWQTLVLGPVSLVFVLWSFFFSYMGYLGKRAVSALTVCNITALTSVVCRIRFNKRIKFSCGQKLVFLYEGKSRLTHERREKKCSVIVEGIYVNALFRFKPKEWPRWHISLFFLTSWRWVKSVISSSNKIVWEWATDQFDTGMKMNTNDLSFLSLQKFTFSRWMSY